jgi:hypothetical protein
LRVHGLGLRVYPRHAPRVGGGGVEFVVEVRGRAAVGAGRQADVRADLPRWRVEGSGNRLKGSGGFRNVKGFESFGIRNVGI